MADVCVGKRKGKLRAEQQQQQWIRLKEGKLRRGVLWVWRIGAKEKEGTGNGDNGKEGGKGTKTACGSKWGRKEGHGRREGKKERNGNGAWV